LRIDHVFGRGLLATKVTVEPVAGSDHFAVIADLELTDD
jgi:endonuclease/exonuclease/phosphatase (EEP) superfamily protein YafD